MSTMTSRTTPSPSTFTLPPAHLLITAMVSNKPDQVTGTFSLRTENGPTYHTAIGPTYPRETITTRKSEHNSVNQGAIILAPPPNYDLSDRVGIMDDTQALPVYHGPVFGDKRFASPVYKYVIPITLAVCLLATIMFVGILCKRLRCGSRMSRASCVLLLSVATADALTMISAVVEVIYMYSQSLDNNLILPLSSCQTMFILERLSAIPHALSTWFTVILAIQRYVCISYPFLAWQHISVKRSFMVVLIVTLLSIGMHLCRFVDTTFVNVLLEYPLMPGKTIQTCKAVYHSWIADAVVYESLFAWTRIVIFQLVPCILIAVFVLLILKSLQNMKHASRHLQITFTKQHSKRRRLSRFVIVIGFIVICMEISNAIYLSFNAWEISTVSVLLSYETLKSDSLGFDHVLYLSYFLIFMLYCLMSGKLRRTITKFFQQTWFDHSKPEILDTTVNNKKLDPSQNKTKQTSFSISFSM